MESIKANVDKLILLFLVTLYFWFAVHGNSAYAQRTSDLILGALLTLLTGKPHPKE
jgi:multisubunit Na+/H+ antiporter MnhE subunit